MRKSNAKLLYTALCLSLMFTGCRKNEEVASINENETITTEDTKNNENSASEESVEKGDKTEVSQESKDESSSNGQAAVAGELIKIIEENSEYQTYETLIYDLQNVTIVLFKYPESLKDGATVTGDLWCYGDGFYRLIKKDVNIRTESMTTVTVDGELWLRYDEDHSYYATSTLFTLDDNEEWKFLYLPGILDKIDGKSLSVTQYIKDGKYIKNLELTMMEEEELLSYSNGQEILASLKENNVLNSGTVKLGLLKEAGTIYTENLYEDGDGISYEYGIYQEKEENLVLSAFGSMGFGHCNDWTDDKTIDEIRDTILYSDSDEQRFKYKISAYSKEKNTIDAKKILGNDQVSDEIQTFQLAYDAIVVLSDMKDSWEVYDPEAWERLNPDGMFYIVLNETGEVIYLCER